MNDRELLELAAKAAGYEQEWTHNKCEIRIGHDWAKWNPLADDGDALRLEVALNLTQKHRFLEILYEENGQCDGDYCKARRRAIVRAAAEIGRG